MRQIVLARINFRKFTKEKRELIPVIIIMRYYYNFNVPRNITTEFRIIKW